MPLDTTNIKAIASVEVGSSGTYAVTSFEGRASSSGPEGQSGEHYLEQTWTIEAIAVADTLAEVSALGEALRDDLCKRGQAVTLTEFSGSRSLPAAGESGSLAGFPQVEITELPDKSFGTLITFRLVATTRIPQPDENDLVEHDYQRVESIDEDENTTVNQSGTVRVTSGEDARGYAETNIIEPERTIAEAAGDGFSERWTLGTDASVVQYEFSTSPAGSNPTGAVGVTDAQVVDRTAKRADGRWSRTVSGYAEGPGAATYIATLKPAADAANILVRDEISQPEVTSGRISFTYELITGITDENFPGIVIFRFAESITEDSGGSRAVGSTYFNDDPVLRLGAPDPYIYTQATSIEFAGDWDDHGITPAMDEDYLVGLPTISKSGGPNGIKNVTVRYQYVFPDQQTVPDPREVAALA